MTARQEAGLDADRDLKVVGLGGLDAQLAALARSEIAAFVWGDGGAVTEARASRGPAAPGHGDSQWISQTQYATEDAIAKQAEAIRKAMRALFRAIQSCARVPKEAAEARGQEARLDAGSGARRPQDLGPAHVRRRLDQHGGAARMQDTLLEQGLLKKKLPPRGSLHAGVHAGESVAAGAP